MKKKAIVKEQRKAVKKELTNRINVALQTVIANFTTSKKAEKIAAKNAKQLVKKLAKGNLAFTNVEPEHSPVDLKKKSKPVNKKDEKPE